MSIISIESITCFESWLKAEDRSSGTIQKYIRDITALSRWLNESPLTMLLTKCAGTMLMWAGTILKA